MEDRKPENNPINQEENPSSIPVDNSADNSNSNDAEQGGGGCGGGSGGDGGRRQRTRFTDLSQEDADLSLARTLQEQERAYMMLRMNVGDGSNYGSWEAGSYGHEVEEDGDFDDPSEEEFGGTEVEDEDEEEEEDAFDVNAQDEEEDEEEEDDIENVEIDPSAYSSDEAYARALQDAEEREMAARLMSMAGISEMVIGEDDDDEEEEHGGDSQDAWEDVDPDELSYEELLALGEVVGTESRGLSADTIASLPSMNYKSQCTETGSSDSCVICRLDYEEDEKLTVLSCKHSYHSDCIYNWLKINKVCPVCSAEVSTSGNS